VFIWLKKVITVIKLLTDGRARRKSGSRQSIWYVDYALGQSRGKKRPRNEDSLYADTWQVAWADVNSTAGLFLVADGMGGHANGQLASKTAAVVFSEVFKAGLPSLNQGEGMMDPVRVVEKLQDALHSAHRAVLQRVPGGGTTLTAVYHQNGSAWFIHAGDTRIYLFSPGVEPQLLTTDHSLVQRLVDIGQIFPEKAAQDPRRNILYMALGQAEPVEPETGRLDIPSGAILLLCSDGLWGSVRLDEINAILASEDLLQAKANQLVEAANLAGGPDNISVCLVKCWQEGGRSN